MLGDRTLINGRRVRDGSNVIVRSGTAAFGATLPLTPVFAKDRFPYPLEKFSHWREMTVWHNVKNSDPRTRSPILLGDGTETPAGPVRM